jgi:signal transduction histidine kinase
MIKHAKTRSKQAVWKARARAVSPLAKVAKRANKGSSPPKETSSKKDLSGETAGPSWASESVFVHTKTVTWEGWASPLEASALFPRRSPLVKTVFAPKGNGPISWSDAIHPIDKSRVKRHFDGLTNESKAADIEYRLVDKNGSVIWVRHATTAAEKRGNRLYLEGFVTDVQTEKEFQLESLRVSEREQNRIGQDLHDDLCQVLAGVSCLMRVIEGRIAGKVPEEVASFTELNQQIVDAMHRTRALTHGLFPGKIQIADIRGALLELASQIRARFKVTINTEFSGRFPRHSRPQIIQIYRLAQEAMSNSIKHGQATQIDVRLEALSDTMVLSVVDNGSGIDSAAALEGGVGLHIMRYRTQTLGGEFALRNGPDRGAIAQLRYPFEN